MRIDPLNWQKPSQSALPLRVHGRWSEDDGLAIKEVTLNGQGLTIEARPLSNEGGAFSGFVFDPFRLNDTVDVRGQIDWEAGMIITGGTLDVRPFLRTERDSNNQDRSPIKAIINLDSVQLGKKITLRDFRANLSFDKTISGPFSGRLSGTSRVQGAFFEQNGRTGFEARSAQGGASLVAVGATAAASGGNVSIRMSPARQKNAMNGYVKANNIKLQKAPVLAEILNAISIVGLVERLSGPGILLNEIEGQFRLEGDQVILKTGTAFGPSLGISLDGYFDLGTEIMDLQGVLSPLYAFNAIGSIFTRKGEGLLGFNFALKGKAGNADLVVNPLSIFTPAIFRNIFRRPPPQYNE